MGTIYNLQDLLFVTADLLEQDAEQGQVTC